MELLFWIDREGEQHWSYSECGQWRRTSSRGFGQQYGFYVGVCGAVVLVLGECWRVSPKPEESGFEGIGTDVVKCRSILRYGMRGGSW